MTCSRCLGAGCGSCQSPPPPGYTWADWAALMRRCRQFDDQHNFGTVAGAWAAAEQQEERGGKGASTSGNGTHVRGRLKAENESGPGAGCTAPDLAGDTGGPRHG